MRKYLGMFLLIFCAFFLKSTIYAENFDTSNIEAEQLLVKNDLNDADFQASMPQVEFKSTFMKMIFILTLLVALIFFTFWIFRRLMKTKIEQANLTKNIKVIERRTLSPKSILYLIEIDGKKVLISESNLEVRKIKDLDD
ncbi:MAG: flagellar biosynthetic protein FliO [Parachlamydiales bacterium]|nr:flagellar biosynthetic protein FliO [Parachlamydiales bacterium]